MLKAADERGGKMKVQEMIRYLECHGFISDEVKDSCIDALKKQIPKKPIDDKAFGICPCCHEEFNSELVGEYDLKYCLRCGQKLDWR